MASEQLDRFGPDDLAELRDDAARVAILDQLDAGLDVITDGEQTRFDFNLSFYGFLEGLALETKPVRRFGPPAHDQRGKHGITGEIRAPRGLGSVEEFERLRRLAPEGPALKVSVPGPYTLSGRIMPGGDYKDRWAVTEALLPVVSAELRALVEAGCREICVDEPSMSCYAYKEDPARLASIFNRTVADLKGRCRLSTHLCFGNYKARAVAPRRYAPMLPEFLKLEVDEVHLEMASREFAELKVLEAFAERMDVSVGVIDVKSYFIETPSVVAARIKRCLEHVPADKLSVAPDCGLSQTARWAAKKKLKAMCDGARIARG